MNYRNPYTNLLSANYGVNQLGGFQMPLRSHMTSYSSTAVFHGTALEFLSIYTYKILNLNLS